MKKYKETILYLFFGGCATLVNIISYAVFSRYFHMEVVSSTICAWALSVIFAYITNRIWVFESSVNTLNGICKEIVEFVGCRMISGARDVFVMWFFVDVVGCPDIIIKIISNVFVVLFNYVASKFFIFKKN